MTTVIHTAEPGSAEWLACRAGVITASKAHLIRSSNRLKTGPNKGDYKEEAKKYAFRLAVERIGQTPIAGEWTGWEAERGLALEPKARERHEVVCGVVVDPAGFVATDDGRFGATADGFIGDDEGAEYKCYLDCEKLQDVLLYGDTSMVVDQCDMGLWLTGRKRWRFGLYCPALEPIRLDFVEHIVERDEERIEALVADLMAFDKLVGEYEARLRLRASAPTKAVAAEVAECL